MYNTQYSSPGAGLNSFAVMGAVPQTVNKTQLQSLASIGYTGVKANLTGASASTSLARYTIVYQLNSQVSAVGQLTETYTVTPNSVSVSYAIANYRSSVSNLVVRVPAFLYDGQRNTSVSTSATNAKVMVSLPGDAVSGLGRTCATYAVGGSSPVFSTEPLPYYSRNGFMNAINAVIGGGPTAPASLTITPSC